MGFVVGKAALGQAFSKYFGFAANHSTVCFTLSIILNIVLASAHTETV
jgi:hypothetical protein